MAVPYPEVCFATSSAGTVESISAALVIFIVLGVVAGIITALGASPLIGIFVALGIIVIGGGLALALTRGPREVAQHESKQEFLGPGGPDDPSS
jgi:predicted phage tail protein